MAFCQIADASLNGEEQGKNGFSLIFLSPTLPHFSLSLVLPGQIQTIPNNRYSERVDGDVLEHRRTQKGKVQGLNRHNHDYAADIFAYL